MSCSTRYFLFCPTSRKTNPPHHASVSSRCTYAKIMRLHTTHRLIMVHNDHIKATTICVTMLSFPHLASSGRQLPHVYILYFATDCPPLLHLRHKNLSETKKRQTDKTIRGYTKGLMSVPVPLACRPSSRWARDLRMSRILPRGPFM